MNSSFTARSGMHRTKRSSTWSLAAVGMAFPSPASAVIINPEHCFITKKKRWILIKYDAYWSEIGTMQHNYIHIIYYLINKHLPQPEKQQAQPVENARLEMALSHCRLVSSPALTIRDLMDGKGIKGLPYIPKPDCLKLALFSVPVPMASWILQRWFTFSICWCHYSH